MKYIFDVESPGIIDPKVASSLNIVLEKFVFPMNVERVNDVFM